jgi:hypothetical protein
VHPIVIAAPLPFALLVLGDATGTAQGLDIGSLIAQIGVAGAAVWWAMRSERRAEAAEERERKAHAEQIEIFERLVPVLIAGTAALEATRKGLERQVDLVRSETHLPLRDTLERLASSLEILDERLPKPPRGQR